MKVKELINKVDTNEILTRLTKLTKERQLEIVSQMTYSKRDYFEPRVNWLLRTNNGFSATIEDIEKKLGEITIALRSSIDYLVHVLPDLDLRSETEALYVALLIDKEMEELADQLPDNIVLGLNIYIDRAEDKKKKSEQDIARKN